MIPSLRLGVLAAANLGLGFLFQWYALALLGPKEATDALFAGMTIPQIVLSVIAGSLMHVLVPLLAGEDEERLGRDAWSLFALVGGFFFVVALVLYATARWWVPLTVPGFDEATQALTIKITRIQLASMVFTAINGVQWAAYHARRRFLWAELAPLLVNGLCLPILVWSLPRFGIVAAAWVNTLRTALITALLAPGMGRPRLPNLGSPAIAQAWKRMRPLLLGAAYYKTDPLIERFLLSTANAGSLSLYHLAQQIYGSVSQLINRSVAAPLVPLLSMLHKANDRAGLVRAYYRQLARLALLVLLGAPMLAALGHLLLKLFIDQGSGSAAQGFWWIMLCLSGVFAGGVLGQISSSLFFALGDTATPTRIGMITYTIYIPAKIALYSYFGPAGLAVSSSAFALANFALQHLSLRSRYLMAGAADP